jgi:hypothetical protein
MLTLVPLAVLMFILTGILRVRAVFGPSVATGLFILAFVFSAVPVAFVGLLALAYYYCLGGSRPPQFLNKAGRPFRRRAPNQGGESKGT